MPSNSSAKYDDDSIRRALEQADLNVLRIVLYQITGDPSLATMRLDKQNALGGSRVVTSLADEHRADVIDKALAYLRKTPRSVPPPPSKPEVRKLMELFTAEQIPEDKLGFGMEELAFDEFPRDIEWRNKPPDAQLQSYKVMVIGAGVGGIAAAVQLERLGIPYVVVERQGDIGGTWRLNDYPDIRVDVSAQLYEFKFEKNYPWTHFFPRGKEILAYLQHIVGKYGIRDKIRLNTHVVSATWKEEASLWTLEITGSNGAIEVVSANSIISASGLFATPNFPNIQGIETFSGRMFHTTAWDYEYDLKDKRIALVGTGSSGSQLMPRVAEVAATVKVFQRTPNWVAEAPNYRARVPDEMRWLFDNVPYYWNWYGYSVYHAMAQMQRIQTYDRDWQKAGGLISEPNDAVRKNLTEYITSKVGDNPDLLRKCLPSHAPWARRMVVDNGWFEALRRDNVELIVNPIAKITPRGIVTVDGTEHEFDVILLGSGFKVSKYMWPVRYTGRNGATLEELWAKDGARAYLGMCMPGFPNFFMFYGPDGQPRAAGYHSWAEIWTRYAVGAIVQMLENNYSSMECKRSVFEEYNQRMDLQSKNFIWEREGANGYYVNEFGRSAVNMPWSIYQYRSWIVEPNPNDFDIKSAARKDDQKPLS
jgi:4-hydroxyacetophenone monooxygenase